MKSHRSRLVLLAKAMLDGFALAAVLVLAFLIRFEGELPDSAWQLLWSSVAFVVLIKLLCCLVLGVHRLTWRYVSLREATTIFLALTLASGFLVAWRIVGSTWLPAESKVWHGQVPLGVLLVDLPLGFLALTGLRVAARKWGKPERTSCRQPAPERVRTLLIGAGDAGAWVARNVATRFDVGIEAIGFLDDDRSKWGLHIHGIPVLGPIARLAEMAHHYRAPQVLITMAGARGDTVRRIVQQCEAAGLKARVVPDLEDIVDGYEHFSHIREVAIEDLLRRQPIDLDRAQVRGVVEGRTVMVTGAGGSIGSELCREICRFGPRKLILVEKTENNLFLIHRELLVSHGSVDLTPCIANICDAKRMRGLFDKYRPEIVFHAAAHKHVPMMEWNPGEAIKNNVLGTRAVADLAHAYGTREFVMISTDKAVNPTSVMGVSKRVAELYIQALSRRSDTRFVTVRFGNVLGSAGSVIPIFKEQIARGGPVTVTHPEMKRYFMTIPEACQLVLQAAALGKNGEVLILDMGEPVMILDLAKDLIRLSGMADGSVEIKFTGMRPGEKLFEDLSLEEEQAEMTAHPRIFVGRVRCLKWDEINRHLEELRSLADCDDRVLLLDKFKEIVLEYAWGAPNPVGENYECLQVVGRNG